MMAQMASVLQSNLMGHVPSSIAISGARSQSEPEIRKPSNLARTLEASGFMGPDRAKMTQISSGA